MSLVWLMNKSVSDENKFTSSSEVPQLLQELLRLHTSFHHSSRVPVFHYFINNSFEIVNFQPKIRPMNETRLLLTQTWWRVHSFSEEGGQIYFLNWSILDAREYVSSFRHESDRRQINWKFPSITFWTRKITNVNYIHSHFQFNFRFS